MKTSLFGLGVQGRSPNVTAQKRQNLYFDIQKSGDKTRVAAYCTPGLVLFSTPSGNPTRGMWWFEGVNKLYAVQRGVFYEVNPDGTATSRGTLATTDIQGNVSMSDNGTQLIIVTGANGYIYNPTTLAFAQIGAPFPGGDTVTFLDSFFIVNKPNTGQIWISSSYDGLTWNALNLATAESNPDNIRAVASDRGLLVIFGVLSTEIWANTGALDFPFSRIGGAPSNNGLAARWSLARVNDMWTGVFRNRQGAYTFAQLDGYNVVSISNPDLDYALNKYANPEDAVAFSYTMNGHSFYQVTFKTENVSWLYDSGSGAWSKMKSFGLPRHRADIGVAFNTLLLVSDYADGRIYSLSSSTFNDNGDPIEREIVGSHFFASKSLNRLRIQRLRVDMESGVGLATGQGSDPTIMLQISRDGGHTWGGELWTSWGKIGEYMRRAEWRRLGIARDWLFKLRVTDPVNVVLMDAYLEADEAIA